jgi:glycosyltransferase involved in cell wall biosynthesis
MTLIEAFATGLPVVASRLGSLEELVSHGITGLHFTPGDPIDLAEKMAYAFKQSRHMNSMRVAARMEFTTRYGAGLNYSTLIDIYEKARAIRASAG